MDKPKRTYYWMCRDCGERGWTDTTPTCSCEGPDNEIEIYPADREPPDPAFNEEK